MKPSFIFLAAALVAQACRAAGPEPFLPVAGQPLAANVTRLVEALDFLGAPLPETVRQTLAEAARKTDSERLQRALDEHVLFIVELNPESRIKVRRGLGQA